jgi:hypothetical protein
MKQQQWAMASGAGSSGLGAQVHLPFIIVCKLSLKHEVGCVSYAFRARTCLCKAAGVWLYRVASWDKAACRA